MFVHWQNNLDFINFIIIIFKNDQGLFPTRNVIYIIYRSPYLNEYSKESNNLYILNNIFIIKLEQTLSVSVSPGCPSQIIKLNILTSRYWLKKSYAIKYVLIITTSHINIVQIRALDKSVGNKSAIHGKPV